MAVFGVLLVAVAALAPAKPSVVFTASTVRHINRDTVAIEDGSGLYRMTLGGAKPVLLARSPKELQFPRVMTNGVVCIEHDVKEDANALVRFDTSGKRHFIAQLPNGTVNRCVAQPKSDAVAVLVGRRFEISDRQLLGPSYDYAVVVVKGKIRSKIANVVDGALSDDGLVFRTIESGSIRETDLTTLRSRFVPVDRQPRHTLMLVQEPKSNRWFALYAAPRTDNSIEDYDEFGIVSLENGTKRPLHQIGETAGEHDAHSGFQTTISGFDDLFYEAHFITRPSRNGTMVMATWFMSDGAHPWTGKIDLATGRWSELCEGEYIGDGPGKDEVLSLVNHWEGRYKRGGARLGRIISTHGPASRLRYLTPTSLDVTGADFFP